MKLDLTQAYKRIDNILYCNDIAIVKFTHSKFPDIDPLTEQGVKYMQSYIDVWSKHGYFEILPGWMIADDPQVEPIDVEKCKQSVEYFVDKVVLPRSKFQQAIENVANEVEYEVESVSVGEETVHLQIQYQGVFTPIEVKAEIVYDQEETHNPNDSRLDQVRFWFNKGLTSASKVAEKINANSSYVQRLLKQVKDESTK